MAASTTSSSRLPGSVERWGLLIVVLLYGVSFAIPAVKCGAGEVWLGWEAFWKPLQLLTSLSTMNPSSWGLLIGFLFPNIFFLAGLGCLLKGRRTAASSLGGMAAGPLLLLFLLWYTYFSDEVILLPGCYLWVASMIVLAGIPSEKGIRAWKLAGRLKKVDDSPW